MKNRKYLMIIAILALAIGFATVSTVLYINGTINVAPDEAGFKEGITFKDVSITNGTVASGEGLDTITFTTEDFSNIGDEAVLTYKIDNASSYDAKVTGITCRFYNSETTEYDIKTNDYVSIMPASGFYPVTVNKSTTSEATTLTVKQIKSYAGTSESNEFTLKYQCKLDVTTDTDAASTGDTYSDSGNILFNKVKSLSLGSSSSIDFNETSNTTSTNGVYKLNGNTNVYFYRGTVDNNIIFANFCWKIVRTTENGGTKLIYNGAPIDGKCTTQTGDETTINPKLVYMPFVQDQTSDIIGYTYTVDEKEQDSLIKIANETWYENNIKNYTYMLEDEVWCNDREELTSTSNITSGISSDYTRYQGVSRSSYFTKVVSPSIKCNRAYDSYTVSTDNGNGLLKYPVGLITSDELVLAGFTSAYDKNGTLKDNSKYYNENTYLNNSSASDGFWTMTPVYLQTKKEVGAISIVYSGKSLNYSLTENGFGVRPMISLKAGTVIDKSGDGTINNPYVVLYGNASKDSIDEDEEETIKACETDKAYSNGPGAGASLYFGSGITYDSSTGKYSLINPELITISSSVDLTGKYSLFSASSTATSSSAFYVKEVNSETGAIKTYIVAVNGECSD